jgi:hypothetical protein
MRPRGAVERPACRALVLTVLDRDAALLAAAPEARDEADRTGWVLPHPASPSVARMATTQGRAG